MDRLNTISLSDDDIDEKYYSIEDNYDNTEKILIRRGEYESIEAIECKSLMNSILIKSGWYDFIDEDIEHYYYKCNKDDCKDTIVFYVNRDEHINYHHCKNLCCNIL